MSAGDPWIRNGVVQEITDGDTLRIMVDLGYRVYHQTIIRLVGIDTPEHTQKGWTEARNNLAALAPPGTSVVVTTKGPDKYGDRWLGSVLVGSLDLATAQLTGGFARPYAGGKKEPWPT